VVLLDLVVEVKVVKVLVLNLEQQEQLIPEVVEEVLIQVEEDQLMVLMVQVEDQVLLL
jgi:hypothetical protein